MAVQLSTIGNANIYQKPLVNTKSDYNQATIGDLHANAMKFIYFLIAEGVFDISEDDYQSLVNIYRKDIYSVTDATLKQDIKTFNDIIDNRLTLKTPKLVRLIGDEVGDRGQNDYFILRILQKLHQSDVPVEILMSNHGVELVQAIEQLDEHDGTFQKTILHESLARSLDNMEHLRSRGVISQKEVLDMTSQAYKPNLKAISYSLNEATNEITLYSHAAIDLRAIEYLANKLNIGYVDSTPHELARTIEVINYCIQKHVERGTLYSLYSVRQLNKGYCMDITLTPENPLEFIMWNRYYENAVNYERQLSRKADHNGYKINYVHGHDSYDPLKDEAHICNLDNMLGKHVDTLFRGPHSVLHSNDINLSKQFSSEDLESFIGDNLNSFDVSSMLIISGFVTAIGLAAVSIALTVLSLGTASAVIMGVGCSGIALVTSLTMFGMFQSSETSSKPLPPMEIELAEPSELLAV